MTSDREAWPYDAMVDETPKKTEATKRAIKVLEDLLAMPKVQLDKRFEEFCEESECTHSRINTHDGKTGICVDCNQSVERPPWKLKT